MLTLSKDNYAIDSYKKAISAAKEGIFAPEIVSVQVPGPRGQPAKTVSEDEEYKTVSGLCRAWLMFI